MKTKVIRTSTISISLAFLLKGQLSFLNNEYEVVGVSGQDKYLEQVKKSEKIRTVAVSMQRKISPLQDLLSLWRLFWLFRKEKPQIVHSITPKAGLLSMVAAYFARVPIRIHTFTGLIFPSKTGMLQKILILMDKILCSFATHVYPEGQGVRQDLIQFKITDKPLKVLANGNVNGIDVIYFNPKHYSDTENQLLKQKLGVLETDFVFIFVGRLVGDKGINELLKAFDELTKEYNNLKLILVGPQEENLDPLTEISLLILMQNKDIKQLGFQADVRSFFSISDALVFPSYREGFPNVVLQAGAMGLPSIVSDINGCNEIIIPNENGIIVPAKNSKALNVAMKQLLNDKVLRNKLGQNARGMVVSRFQQQVVWDSILAEYKKLEKCIK